MSVCGLQMTKELLSGWAGTHDLMHNMLEEKIAPTASALTRLGLRQSDKQTHLNGFPSVTRHYFEHGGRSETSLQHLNCTTGCICVLLAHA